MLFSFFLVFALWLTFPFWKSTFRLQAYFVALQFLALGLLCASFVWGRIDKTDAFAVILHPHLVPQEYDPDALRVYQQVIRTGSDAVEKLSFFVDFKYEPIRTGRQHGPPTLLHEHILAHPEDYPGFSTVEEVLHNKTSVNVIKGYLCKRDIDMIRNESERPVRLYTMMRDPVERVLSFYDYLIHQRDPWTAFNITGKRHRIRKLRGAAARNYILSNLWNGATHQYGDVQYLPYRKLGDDEVLESAKRHLESMTYVGFFEDMGEAYWTMSEEFTRPSASLFTRLLTRWGSIAVTAPRLRVRKWRADWEKKMGKEFIQYVEEHVVPLDIKLYQWASERFGGPQLFDSYAAYAIAMMDYYVMAFLCVQLVLNGLVFSYWAVRSRKIRCVF